MKMKLMRREWK